MVRQAHHGVKSVHKNQYTIRNLPPELDKTLRQKSKKTGKSLNTVVLETLVKGSGLANKPVINHDLDFMIGSWVEDPEFDKVVEEHDRIDEEMWK